MTVLYENGVRIIVDTVMIMINDMCYDLWGSFERSWKYGDRPYKCGTHSYVREMLPILSSHTLRL